METWTIARTLAWTADYFSKQHFELPHLEAEILLAHALGLKRIEIYTKHEKVLSPEELERFRGSIQRRVKHEPIAYITGAQPFMSLEFIVDRSVLIPRPETEQLVEIAMEKRPDSIVDVGTGSGAIAISLAKYLPNVKVIGTDASPAALNIARQNAEKHKVSDRCVFIEGNLFGTIEDKVDLVISNPPYIPSAVIDTLQPEVKDREPRQALDGGEDGLKYIRDIITQASSHLAANGLLLIEIGFDQGEAVRSLAEKSGQYKDIEIIKDLNGKDRILKVTAKP